MTLMTHDAYFESVSESVAKQLVSIQETVEILLPEASRCISYNMPAYRNQRVFFYFAAFKKHIGIYPPVTQDTLLIQELAKFRNEKGNLSFPLNEPLPIEMIGRIAVALSIEYDCSPIDL
jgi:uncharacterized protein YdhG (YjbR/CyaY superfamily)